MTTISRVRLVLTPFIVAALLGIAGCSTSLTPTDSGVSGSIDEGQREALKVSLRFDALNIGAGLKANALDRYPRSGDISNMLSVAGTPIAPDNKVTSYKVSADGTSFTVTLTNHKLGKTVPVTYDSTIGNIR